MLQLKSYLKNTEVNFKFTVNFTADTWLRLRSVSRDAEEHRQAGRAQQQPRELGEGAQQARGRGPAARAAVFEPLDLGIRASCC